MDTHIVVQSAELPAAISELEPDPESGLDLASLQLMNRDIIGWLRIDETDIDYPLLQGNDNDYYLSRNYLREWATAGSIFVDYRNAADLSDFLTVIYGHRMSYGKMFSDITKYVGRDYFDNHQVGRIYIGEKEYGLQVMAFARVKATEQRIYDVAKSRVDTAAAELIYNKSIWHRDKFKDGRYVLLSTCDAKDKSLRDVLLLYIKNSHDGY